MLQVGTALLGTAEDVTDAVAGAAGGWLVVAVLLHFAGQVGRGLAWYHSLRATWPRVTRRRVCAWSVCGAGVSGLLSGRGGDAVRLALAKRDLPAATWPALIGTALVEAGAQTLVALIPAAVVLAIGVRALPLPPAPVVGAVAAAAVAGAVLAVRSARARRVVAELMRGFAALRGPRRCVRRILAWEVVARLLRLAAAACFLRAFGLPTGLPVVLTVGILYGSGGALPIPGAGQAASASALLVAVPMAAGHPLDARMVSAMAIAQPVVLTAAGLAVSLGLFAALIGARTPRSLLAAGRSLVAEPPAAAAEPG